MHARRPRGQRGVEIAHGRLRIVLRVDLLAGVGGDVAVFGDDDRHGLADVADDVARQERSGRPAGRRRDADRRLGIDRAIHIARGDHTQHARDRGRAHRVEAPQPRMRMRRAQHAREDQARRRQVVHETPCALDERGVLAPPDVGADERLGRHARPPRRP